jgi:inner membrane transporter RhtA
VTTSLLNRIPAPAVFVVGAVSMYVGAALAVGLFDHLSPAVVAVLRIVGASIVLLLWRRPKASAWRWPALGRSAAYGLATGGMNIAFYMAIARLPLGTVVAVEFCGPVLVAALLSRRARDVAAVVLAAAGVALIADVRWSGSPSGVLWALLAAGLWAAYIVLGKRVANAGNGLDDMAVGFTVSAVLLSPLLLLGGPDGLAQLADPVTLLLAVGVGVLSSVVPYVLDQVVLRRLGQARFAVLLALLPATATVIGLVGLAQVPGVLEGAGIVAVIAAVALRSRDGDVSAAPPDATPTARQHHSP